MSVEVDLDVEASYYPSEDGEYGMFNFGLPNASVVVKMARTEAGATDAALLVEHLIELWTNVLVQMTAQSDLTDSE